MLALPGNAKHAWVVIPRAFARNSRAYSAVNAPPDAPPPTTSLPRRTKKKTSELPTKYILPDGTIAPPLDDSISPTSSSAFYLSPDTQKPTGGRRKSCEKTTNSTSVYSFVRLNDPVHESEASTDKLTRIEEDLDPGAEDTVKKGRRKAQKVSSEEVLPKPKKRGTRSKPLPEASTTKPMASDPPQSPLMGEIRANMSRFPHCLLLTRIGNFYESYYEQAEEVSRLLNIKLASRRYNGGRVFMCGFPIMHLDKYLKVLVLQNQRFVAMCEEFVKISPFGGGREFERRVVRVITPGTLIDESFLNQFENNFLLSISPSLQTPSVGLAWIDVSTGEFFSKVCPTDNLGDQLARINPREVALHSSLKSQSDHPIRQALAEDAHFITFTNPNADTDALAPTSNLFVLPDIPPQSYVDVASAGDQVTEMHVPSSYSVEEQQAISLLTAHLHQHLMEHMPTLTRPSRESDHTRMQIDYHTMRALEIRERAQEGSTKGSLLSVVKRTVTTGGTRLLSRWLSSPSTSTTEINARQELVSFFLSRPHFRADIAALLRDAEDASRIVQRFLMGRGEPSDLLGIHHAIRTWDAIRSRILEEKSLEQQGDAFIESDWASLDSLTRRFSDLRDLASRIHLAVQDTTSEPKDAGEGAAVGEQDEDSRLEPNTRSEFNFIPLKTDGRIGTVRKFSIHPQFSQDLTRLHNALRELVSRREELELQLQHKLAAPSLTLRASPSQGFHVHLGKKREHKLLSEFQELTLLTESGSTKTYFHAEWSRLAGLMIETTSELFSAEKLAFEGLRREVSAHTTELRKNARITDELDVTLGFAELASEMQFVRPQVVDTLEYTVQDGRHPTVELGLLASGRVFTPNSLHLSPGSEMQQIITGPNMGGKSTYLRQAALIAILAQTGSFVPAGEATLGVVDKIFSRIGAKDDLFYDRSTFMVEMLETADILRRATPRSLVIMDEVGRGTTVRDGLAIAFATIHHLITVNRCRTLFATHFHELAAMLGRGHPDRMTYHGIGYQCFDVHETDDGHFAYSYKIREGVNFASHGLKVAKLAGMPALAVEVAQATQAALGSHQMFSGTQLWDIGRKIATLPSSV